MSAKLAKRLVKPDHCNHPVWVQTYGPEVCEINARAGLAPDPQQEHILDALFGILPDGRPAAFAQAIIAARQNLKTGVLKMAANGWMVVTEQPLIVWSAHELDTTLEAHRDLAGMWEDTPFLAKRLKPGRSRDGIKANNNEALIEMASGQRVKFKARTKTGGRGLSGNKVILDEAFALTPLMLGALLPTMTARPHGQVVYASSAGMASSASLRDIRDRGRSGSSPRLGYDEWLAPREDCADPDCLHPKDALEQGIDCALDREHLIVAANPTISTGRINIQTIRDLRQELPPAEFMRESLGWWDEEDSLDPPAIDLNAWSTSSFPKARMPAAGNVVLDVSPDRKTSTIAVAGTGPKGRTLLVVRREAGTAWVVPRLKRMSERRNILEVALNPVGQAGSLIPALVAEGIEFETITTQEAGRACSWFQQMVETDQIAHAGQPELDQAVANARTVTRGEAELWDRRDPSIDIGPVVGGSQAAYRFRTQQQDYDVLDSIG